MLIVKKFGGTSVANKERIFNVAARCIEEYLDFISRSTILCMNNSNFPLSPHFNNNLKLS